MSIGALGSNKTLPKEWPQLSLNQTPCGKGPLCIIVGQLQKP